MGVFKNLFKAKPGGSIARNFLESLPKIGSLVKLIPQNKKAQQKNAAADSEAPSTGYKTATSPEPVKDAPKAGLMGIFSNMWFWTGTGIVLLVTIVVAMMPKSKKNVQKSYSKNRY